MEIAFPNTRFLESAPKSNKRLKFERLVQKMFDFLNRGLNKGLKFEPLVRKKNFDYLSPGSNKGLKFGTLIQRKFADFLSMDSRLRPLLEKALISCGPYRTRDSNLRP